jgi:hypothetical protein
MSPHGWLAKSPELHAHAGILLGVLDYYGGEAGFGLECLPELNLRMEPEFDELPYLVRALADPSKTRGAYNPLGTQHLATALLAYLKVRQDAVERLGATSRDPPPDSARVQKAG